MFALFKSVKGLPPLAAVVVALIVGFSTGMIKGRKPRVVTEYIDRVVTQVQVDTVFVDKPVVRYVTKAIRDTVWIEDVPDAPHDDFQIFALASQELSSEGTAYGVIDVEYIFPPWDSFNFVFDPAPLPTIVKTITVEKTIGADRTFWTHPATNFVIGAAFGAVIEKYACDRW